jgi:hypothetical protein
MRVNQTDGGSVIENYFIKSTFISPHQPYQYLYDGEKNEARGLMIDTDKSTLTIFNVNITNGTI